MNPMKTIRLEKVTLNMGAGDSHQLVQSGQKVLNELSKRKVVVTRTRKRSTFGPAKGRDIGSKVTIRGKAGEEMLKRILKAVEGKIKPSQFDVHGNFSLGVKEYIHIPGVNYDPDIGILGLDVAVTLARAGFRVKKRKLRPSPVGKGHLITKEEAMEWAKNFGFTLKEKEDNPYEL